MKPFAFGAGAILLLVLTLEAIAQENSHIVSLGKELAEQHCSRCHVVDPARPFTGISSTPSFSLMVNALEDWEERFSSFHARLPHPSIIRLEDETADPEIEDLRPPIELKYSDINALTAFASSLKKPE